VVSGIGHLLGLGAYIPVKRNSVITAHPVPVVHSTKDTGIRYRHYEYLGDLTGSEEWNITQFRINPGLSEVFPWMSKIAANFQKYRFDGLVFYLRSTSSVAVASSTNLAMGSVMGAFQYRSSDTAPTSMVEFMALSGSTSNRPSEDQIFPMECDPSKNVFGNLLVRTGGVSDDLQKYDHATFNLATVGFQSPYVIGQVWVSYDVLLIAPKTSSADGFLLFNGKSVNETPTVGQKRRIFPTAVPGAVGVLSGRTYNTFGWKVANAPDGTPCFEVPAGTSIVLFSDACCVDFPTEEMGGNAPTLKAYALTNGASLTFEPIVLDSYNWAEFNGPLYSSGSAYQLKTCTDAPTLVRFGWDIEGEYANPAYCTTKMRLVKGPDGLEEMVNRSDSTYVSGILRTPADTRAFNARVRARNAVTSAPLRSASPGASALSVPLTVR